jgi:hypothetical protein
MAYSIYKADGTLVTVADNSIDVDFYNANANGTGKGIGVRLIGRNAVSFGAATAQNFLQLTENFSGSVIPSDSTALQGQLWFRKTSSTAGVLYVRTKDATSGGIANWQRVITEDTTGVSTFDKIRLTGTGDVTLTSTDHPFQIGASSTANIAMDNNEMQARNNSLASSLFINVLGGNVTVGSVSAIVSLNGDVRANGYRVPVVNPASGDAQDGDTRVVGAVISIWASGAWRQIYPAIYA